MLVKSIVCDYQQYISIRTLHCKKIQTSSWENWLSLTVTQLDFSSGVGPLWISIDYSAYHINNLFSFHLGWCMLGRSVWIWTKSNLCQFIESQTQFSTSWHARTSLTLNEPIYNIIFLSKPPQYLHPKLTQHGRYCRQKEWTVLLKSLVELEDHSTGYLQVKGSLGTRAIL